MTSFDSNHYTMVYYMRNIDEKHQKISPLGHLKPVKDAVNLLELDNPVGIQGFKDKVT